jgi:hypothetical protein
MKKWIAAFLALPLSCLPAQTQINDFNDVAYWVGSGQNRAVVVLQWNDGLNPASVAWGYRWDGEATGLDMLRAIAGTTRIEDPAGDPVGSGAGADNRLSLGLVEYSFGLSVLSLDYLPQAGPLRTQSDWFSGYWQYLIRGGNFEYDDWETGDTAVYDVAGSSIYAPQAWTSSPIGAGERPLIDGAWDAYSFAPGFRPQAVEQAVAVSLPVPDASCAMDQGTPSVSVRSKSGFIYQLQYSDDIPGVWQAMGESEPGTGGEIIFRDETPELPTQRFYRIVVRQAP